MRASEVWIVTLFLALTLLAALGLAEIVARETKVIEILAPWLTLDGLRIIWGLNR